MLERLSARIAHSLIGPSDIHPDLEEEAQVSAEVPDWSREECAPLAWLPGRQVLRALRQYQAAEGKPGLRAFAARKLAVVRHRMWSLVAGADIPLNCDIAGGCLILHPNGIVVHPRARIGPNSLLFQQVTIGTGKLPGFPILGGHVEVGAGAKILGGVRIGDHVTIGANAVVLNNVPSGSFAAGVPAVIKR